MDAESASLEIIRPVETLTKLLLSSDTSATGTQFTTTPSSNQEQDEAQEDTKHFLYIDAKWTEEDLTLLLQDSRSSKCYKGCTTLSELKNCAEELEILPTLFMQDCRDALSATIAHPQFQYHIEKAATSQSLTFTVVKICTDPVIYLEIPLTELKSKTQLLDAAIALLHVKQEQLCLSSNKANTKAPVDPTSSRHNSEVLNALGKLVEERDASERRLLKKVTLLLQTKKDRIAELEKQLAEAERRNATDDGGEHTNQPSDDNMETDCSEDFDAPTQRL